MEGRGSAAGHLAVVMLALALALVPGALAATHIVGGSSEWNYPPNNDATYYDSVWAAGQTFVVGDILLFQYTAGQHDVVQYTGNTTAAEYSACSGTALNTYTTGNDSVPLPSAGTYYFICSYPSHCTSGMKVSVTVSTGVAPASPPTTTPSPPSTTPSPPTTTSPPPPATPTGGSGASSGPVLSMAGLFVAALVATLAFLV